MEGAGMIRSFQTIISGEEVIFYFLNKYDSRNGICAANQFFSEILEGVSTKLRSTMLIKKNNMRVKVLAIFLSILMSFLSLNFTSLPAKASPLVSIPAGNINLDAGDYAVFGICADNVFEPGLAGYRLNLKFDPAQIKIMTVTRSAEYASPLPEFNIADLNPSDLPSQLTVLSVPMDLASKTGDFKLFNVKFKALKSLNDVSPFSIDVEEFVSNSENLVDFTDPTLYASQIPDRPDVEVSNNLDQFEGLQAGMEYSFDYGPFTPYDPNNPPSAGGDHEVLVRYAGTATDLPGAEKLLRLTTAYEVSQPRVEVENDPNSPYLSSSNSRLIGYGIPIQLTSQTPEVQIYYTLTPFGTIAQDPTTEGKLYDANVGISLPPGKNIIRAVAVKDGMVNSRISTFIFINRVNLPYAVINGQMYRMDQGNPVEVTVPEGIPVFLGSTTGLDVSFYYTTDGSTPTSTSTVYNPTAGITNLTDDTVLRVIGSKGNLADSNVATFIVDIGANMVDRNSLINIIDSANSLIDNTSVGNQPGQVLQEDMDALISAVSAAQAVLDNTTATQAEIDEAVSVLNEAITAFNASIIPVTELGHDASLSGITSSIGTLSPAFSKNIMQYTVLLPGGTTSVPEITAVTFDIKANVVITPAASLIGQTVIEVTAEDGTTKLRYYVSFVLPGSDATLSKLEFPRIFLTPNFNKDITSYDALLPAGVTNIPMPTYTTSDPNANVTEVNIPTSLPGTATIEVIASDGITKKVYSVNFTSWEGVEDYILEELIDNPNQFTGVLQRFDFDHLRLVIPNNFISKLDINVDTGMFGELIAHVDTSKVHDVRMYSTDDIELFKASYRVDETTSDAYYQIGFPIASFPVGTDVIIKTFDSKDAEANELDSMRVKIKPFNYVAPTMPAQSYLLKDLVTNVNLFNEILGKYSTSKLHLHGERFILNNENNTTSSAYIVRVNSKVSSVTIKDSTGNTFSASNSETGLFELSTSQLSSGNIVIHAFDSNNNLLDTAYDHI